MSSLGRAVVRRQHTTSEWKSDCDTQTTVLRNKIRWRIHVTSEVRMSEQSCRRFWSRCPPSRWRETPSPCLSVCLSVCVSAYLFCFRFTFTYDFVTVYDVESFPSQLTAILIFFLCSLPKIKKKCILLAWKKYIIHIPPCLIPREFILFITEPPLNALLITKLPLCLLDLYIMSFFYCEKNLHFVILQSFWWCIKIASRSMSIRGDIVNWLNSCNYTVSDRKEFQQKKIKQGFVW